MSEKYFILTANDDGDVSLRCVARQTLLEQINNEDIDLRNICDFCDHRSIDLREASRTFIIKGELVVPHPVEKVVRYTI